jgi:hypothetical protein
MEVEKGKTIYHGSRKIKAGQEIPIHVEKALVASGTKEKAVKNEPAGASGNRLGKKSGR